MKTHTEITNAISKYADTVSRICYLHTQSKQDGDDVFQEVFLKYMTKAPVFNDGEHEKAWIIRVTINLCKDSFKSFFKQNVISLDGASELSNASAEEKEDLSFVREAVKKLPSSYRNVIYLFYYEGYSAVEIADLMHKNVNTVYTWLSRAKNALKIELGGDIFE